MAVLNRCLAFIVARRDGLKMGFTNLDRPLTVAGVECEPRGGFDVSSMEARIGGGVDSADIEGFLSSDRITEEDFHAGVYDKARIEVRLIDWTTGATVKRWPPYVVTDREVRGSLLTLRMEIAAALALNQVQGVTCSGTCRHDFGDAKCGLAMGPLERSAVIAETDGRMWIEVSSLAAPPIGQWEGGLIRIGASAAREIARRDGDRLTAFEPLDGAVVGAAVTLTPGCSKLWGMCKAFGNAPRFGGFPHMPGRDWVVRVARQGDGRSHTGGSIFAEGALEESGDES